MGDGMFAWTGWSFFVLAMVLGRAALCREAGVARREQRRIAWLLDLLMGAPVLAVKNDPTGKDGLLDAGREHAGMAAAMILDSRDRMNLWLGIVIKEMEDAKEEVALNDLPQIGAMNSGMDFVAAMRRKRAEFTTDRDAITETIPKGKISPEAFEAFGDWWAPLIQAINNRIDEASSHYRAFQEFEEISVMEIESGHAAVPLDQIKAGARVIQAWRNWYGELEKTMSELRAGSIAVDPIRVMANRVAQMQSDLKGTLARVPGAVDVKPLVELVEVCEEVFAGPLMDQNPDDESVCYCDGVGLDLTFGHIRRARAALP